LVVPRAQVQYDEIEFAAAYKDNTMELVKAAIEASLQRDNAENMDIGRVERPVIILGQEEDSGLFSPARGV
jgi:hypothetical protein